MIDKTASDGLLSQIQVSQLSVYIFGRASEGDDKVYWLINQKDMISTANAMLGTNAAKDYFGITMNDDQNFIEHIYETSLGKTIVDDPNGIAYWVEELRKGKSRGEVIVSIINAAQEYANIDNSQDQFSNKMEVSNYVTDDIFYSAEYFERFVDFFEKIAQEYVTIVYRVEQLCNLPNNFIAHRVAHAGGGINNKKYTNSIDALNSNLKKKFQYFEIDFSFTADDKLVCLHDWKQSFKRSFGFERNKKLTLDEFNYLVKNKSEFQKCTACSLSEWMKMNPSAIIITDVKENNIEALKIMLEILPNAKTRIIPQVYNPENFEKIKGLGFEKMIWTLYRYRGSNDEVLNWVENFATPFAVTMPKSRAESTLPKELKKRQIPSYVHTVNTTQEKEKYINKFGISEIYTDFLPPSK
ncbi:glycerophosphodiester phosphodiesterase family protein [Desulfocicer vacuolatum]|nr:glycerophosphodiester phosphodiesterase family protein [Desulfocicer vacuolatum]